MSPPGTLVDNVDIHGDETVAVYNSVQCPVMTCVHTAETGGVPLVRIRIQAGRDTNSDQATLHHHHARYNHMTDSGWSED